MRRGQRLGLALSLGALLRLAAGCAVPVQSVCSHCPRLVVGERPPVPLGTRTVFLVVPGLLGYGWEWNGAQIALAQMPAAAVLVYDWDPWSSVRAAGADLAAGVQYLLARLPRSVRRVVLLGHSAAGFLVVQAAAQVQVPPGLRFDAVAVGSPLAGNYFNLAGGADNLDSPLPIAMAGQFTRWPEPAPGVSLTIWTTGGSDPVMRRHFNHDPADVRVLPRAATVHALPADLDHNVAIGFVAGQIVAELRGLEPVAPPPHPPASPASEN
jgi:hypothetical protein